MKKLVVPKNASDPLREAVEIVNELLQASQRKKLEGNFIEGERTYRGSIVIYNHSEDPDAMRQLAELVVAANCLAIIDVQLDSLTFTP